MKALQPGASPGGYGLSKGADKSRKEDPPVALSLPVQWGAHMRQGHGPYKPSPRDGQKALLLILTTGKCGLLSLHFLLPTVGAEGRP